MAPVRPCDQSVVATKALSDMQMLFIGHAEYDQFVFSFIKYQNFFKNWRYDLSEYLQLSHVSCL